MPEEKSPLKEIVKDIIGKIEKEGGGEKGSPILRAWEKAVGEDTSNHTKPVSLKSGRLIVNVTDSSRLYDLTLKKEKIIKGINKCLRKKKVKEIRFKIGEI